MHAGMPGVSQSGNGGIESIPRLCSQEAGNNGGIMARPWLALCAPEGLRFEVDKKVQVCWEVQVEVEM